MAVEDDSVEVEDLAFLKLRAAPDRCERWQVNFVGTVLRAQPDYDRPVLFLHRIQVVHGFEMSWRFAFPDLFDLSLHAICKRLDLRPFRDLRVQPIHPTDIGTIVQAEDR